MSGTDGWDLRSQQTSLSCTFQCNKGGFFDFQGSRLTGEGSEKRLSTNDSESDREHFSQRVDGPATRCKGGDGDGVSGWKRHLQQLLLRSR